MVTFIASPSFFLSNIWTSPNRESREGGITIILAKPGWSKKKDLSWGLRSFPLLNMWTYLMRKRWCLPVAFLFHPSVWWRWRDSINVLFWRCWSITARYQCDRDTENAFFWGGWGGHSLLWKHLSKAGDEMGWFCTERTGGAVKDFFEEALGEDLSEAQILQHGKKRKEKGILSGWIRLSMKEKKIVKALVKTDMVRKRFSHTFHGIIKWNIGRAGNGGGGNEVPPPLGQFIEFDKWEAFRKVQKTTYGKPFKETKNSSQP